ncbi:MAG: hypothetical protein Q8M08_08185 [Bacteroidales bacterium]|nr:hypothetical protein [Bacteroidales bacterium]
METCAVKWIIIGICALITLAGLWLSIYRESGNIKRGKKDIQSIIYDKEKGTFNFSFAIGIVLIGGGLYAMIYAEKNQIGCEPVPVQGASTIKVGRLLFKIEESSILADLRLCQQKPTITNRNITRQDDKYYDEFIEIPEVNEEYFAYVTQSVNTSELRDNAVEDPMNICFTRNEKEIRKDNVIAILKAGKDKKIIQEAGDPGCVVLCDHPQTSSRSLFTLFSAAYAQTPQTESRYSGWTVPNLQTLLEKNKTGFSQIFIKSTALNNQVKEANRFYYAVKVNGIPIYIDGLLPKYIVHPFNYENGLNIEFGLENLGFSGMNKGVEKIEITINFYLDSKFVASSSLSLDYVALRKSDPMVVAGSDGSKYRWEAQFKANNETQIFILSTTDSSEAIRTKRKLDARSLVFNGNKVVGVIRPPYKENRHYGVCAGVVLPNKQIRFTYDAGETNVFNKYLTDQRYKTSRRLLRDN